MKTRPTKNCRNYVGIGYMRVNIKFGSQTNKNNYCEIKMNKYCNF